MTDSPFWLRTVLLTMLGFVIIGLLASYVLFQARYLIGGPQITLDGPLPIATNERAITLTGSAFNISRLWLNDRQIFTNPDGRFEQLLVLENGQTIATIRAEDRYGRATVVSHTFVYVPGCLMYTI
jgi:hypothetical protein